ncbi:alpha-ketoglutarate-dependent dioxygenase AlkB [Allosphingosinicella indica]|uniref:Alkylated DNA repair dioxygenase AlkB n=1 Tax=Allosphingosinicella indica TaxID=941907 RepID=A0A1X7FYH5_9SPHN|nr:alpha-ketoglutarate-dependent dioxygenase AlkB [Allosphingosinicella indica]SMF61077.1 Alkylated DNA repair dioxygenase AlkB [Allosphingosinicella indica]
MSAQQSDLFGSTFPNGFQLWEGLIQEGEEEALKREIDASGLAPFRFQQWLGKRLTASYGWHYDFERQRLAPANPLPDWLTALRIRIAARAKRDADALAQVLLTRYDPGAGIGWHRDRPDFDEIFGVSLGAEAALRFRRRSVRGFERATVPIPPRSLYCLSGPVRTEWEHSIAPIAACRWSITFRTLARSHPET